MSDLLILGTDTDAGKTTFALLWLHCFADRFAYWKPVETGPSDTEGVIQMVPHAVAHPPVSRLQASVAPPLAARFEGATIPAARALASARPMPTQPGRSLLIETFGGPFSPLNESELQLALIRELACPCLLVSSSKLGGIGRTLQCMTALRSEGIEPFAVVLLGPRDSFAEEQLRRYLPMQTVAGLETPDEWTPAALHACAAGQRKELERLYSALDKKGRP